MKRLVSGIAAVVVASLAVTSAATAQESPAPPVAPAVPPTVEVVPEPQPPAAPPVEMSPAEGVAAAGMPVPTAPAVQQGYVEGVSVEAIEARTEYSKRYRNLDGTETVITDVVPMHWLQDGSWTDVDTTLVAEGAGFRSRSNQWSARFDSLPAGVTISTPDGDVVFSPVGAAAVSPELLPEGDGVIYRDAWPSADLRYRVLPDGVKEDIILRERPTVAAFEFTTDGRRFHFEDGRIAPAGGDELGALGDAIAVDADGAPLLDADATLTAVSWPRHLPRVTVSFDLDYLNSLPDDAYPVVIDPPWDFQSSNMWNVVHSGGGQSGADTIYLGNFYNAPHNNIWRSVGKFDYGPMFGIQIASARVELSGGIAPARPISIWATTQAPGAYTYSGVTSNGPYDTQTIGVSGSLDVTPEFQYWIANGYSNISLGFTGTETWNTYTAQYYTDYQLKVTGVPVAPAVPSYVSPGPAYATSAYSASLTARNNDWRNVYLGFHLVDAATGAVVEALWCGGWFEQMTAPNGTCTVSVPLPAGDKKYQWRIFSMAPDGDGGSDNAYSAYTTPYREITVDRTGPSITNVLGWPSAVGDGWRPWANNYVLFTSDDLSGVGTFSYSWDQNPTTTPDSTPDWTGVCPHPSTDNDHDWFVAVPGFPSNCDLAAAGNAADGTWYLHIKAANWAGVWGPPVHVRHQFDRTSPTAPTGLANVCTTPSTGSGPRITANWTGSTDAHSGIRGYSWVWNNSATTAADLIGAEGGPTATSSTSAPLANGTWYLHVRALDNAVHWGDGSSNGSADAVLGPITVSGGVPSPAGPSCVAAPVITSSSHPDQQEWYQPGPDFNASWTVADHPATIAGYQVAFNTNPTYTFSGTTPTQTSNTFTQTAPGPGTWYLHVRAITNGGSASPTARHRVQIAPPVDGREVGFGYESWWHYVDRYVGPEATASVNVANGNLVLQQNDVPPVQAAGDLAFNLRRTYNSQDTDLTSILRDLLGFDLGEGWNLNLTDMAGIGGFTGVGLLPMSGQPALPDLNPTAVVMVDRDGTRHTFHLEGLDAQAGPVGVSVNGAGGLSQALSGLLEDPLGTVASLDVADLLEAAALDADVDLEQFGTKLALCVDARYRPPAGVHVAMWRYVLVDLLDGQQPPNSSCGDLIDAPPGPAGAIALGYVTVRPDRVSQTFGFDGRLLSISDAAGNRLGYAYDTLGRLTTVYEPGVAGCDSFAALQAGCRKLSFAYPDSTTVTATDPAGRTVTYTTASLGATTVLTNVTVSDAEGLLEQWAYRYDGLAGVDCGPNTGVLCAVLSPRHLAADAAAALPLSVVYGADRRVSHISEAAATSGDTAPVTAFTYADAHSDVVRGTQATRYATIDAFGRVHRISAGAPGMASPLRTTRLRWDTDASGCQLTPGGTRQNNLCESALLDVGAASGGDRLTRYEYNAEGALLRETRVGDAGTGGDAITTYSYRTLSYTAAGAPTERLDTVAGPGAVTSAARPTGALFVVSDLTGAVSPRGNAPGAAWSDHRTQWTVDADMNAALHSVGDGGDCGDGNSGLVCVETAPAGIVSTSTFNERGQTLTTSTAPNGPITYAYLDDTDRARAGWLRQTIDPNGDAVTFGYDVAGNTTTVWDRNAFDRNGDATPTDPDEATVTTYGSGLNGNGPWRWANSATVPTTAQDTATHGARTTWTVDAHGNPTITRPPRGNASSVPSAAYDVTATYDGRDRQLTGTDPAGTTRAVYDVNGNPTRTTDANNNPVGTRYDAAGRPVEDLYTRANSGTPPTGCRAATASDESVLGVTSSTVVCAATTTFDEFDQPNSSVDPSGLTTTRTFDRFGRVTVEAWPTTGGRTARVAWGYDLDGNTTTICGLGASQATAEACRTYTLATNPLPAYVTALRFDAAGRPVESRHDRRPVDANGSPSGAAVAVRALASYDTASRVISTTDPNQRQTTYGYDALGRLTRTTTPRSATTSFSTAWRYDASGNTVAVLTEADGTTLGRTTANIDDDPAAETVAITAHLYDETNRPTATIEAAQSDNAAMFAALVPDAPDAADPAARNVRTEYRYDPDGNLIGTFAPRAFEAGLSPNTAWMSRVDYDSAGRAVATWAAETATNGTCPTAGAGHQPAGSPGAANPAYPTGLAVCRSVATWDAASRLLSTTTPGGKVATRAYTNDDLLASITGPAPDGNGTVTATTTYDAVGRPLRTTSPAATTGDWVQQITYSPDGLPLNTRGFAGGGSDLRSASTTYTLAGLAETTRTEGDTPGATAIGPDLVTEQRYFSDGLARESIVDPGAGGLNLTTQFGYDANGNPTSILQPAAAASPPVAPNPSGVAIAQTFTHDNLLEQVTEPEQNGPARIRRTTFTYDPVGHKLSEHVERAPSVGGTPEFGRDARYAYQATGWLALEHDGTDPDSRITYRHNLDGTLADAVDDTSTTPVAVNLDWRYDGRPASQATTIGGDTFSTVAATYRPDGEPATQTTTTADASTGGSTATADSWTYPASASVASSLTTTFHDGSQVVTGYAWTAAGQLSSTTGTVPETRAYLPDGTLASATTALASHTYTSDGLGRVVGQDIGGITGAPDRTYGYDNASRVVDDDNNTGTPGFSYDANSNRTANRDTTFAYRPDNSVASTTTAGQTQNVTYDPAGRRIHPDATDIDCTYTYDFLNRTTGITGGCTEDAAYLHDPLGRQIVQLTGTDVGVGDFDDDYSDATFDIPDGVELHSIFGLVNTDLARTDRYDTTGSTNTAETTSYTADDRAIQHTASGMTAHGTQHLLTDGQGNTIVVTDGTGAAVCSRIYEPFGADHASSTCTETSTANQAWYRGGQQDTADGTYHYGSRHYDPDTAAWTTPDTARPGAPLTDLSIGTDPLTSNRYNYVNGDPINLVDPTGHDLGCGSWWGISQACRAVVDTTKQITSFVKGATKKTVQIIEGMGDEVGDFTSDPMGYLAQQQADFLATVQDEGYLGALWEASGVPDAIESAQRCWDAAGGTAEEVGYECLETIAVAAAAAFKLGLRARARPDVDTPRPDLDTPHVDTHNTAMPDADHPSTRPSDSPAAPDPDPEPAPDPTPVEADPGPPAPRATAGVGPGAASVADPAFSSGPRLYRFGLEAESADDLARLSAEAADAGFPHGVSAFSRSSRPDAVSALRSSVEELFPVIKTGRNPYHYTIELPNPVTTEIAEQFNILFGRGASPL